MVEFVIRGAAWLRTPAGRRLIGGLFDLLARAVRS